MDTRSLEKAPEAAFLKVAQRESIGPPIINTIDSGFMNRRTWLENQNQSHHCLGRFSRISCAHHCSCRKEIALLQSENQAIKFNQETLFSFLTMSRTFAPPSYPPKDPPAGSASSNVDGATEVFPLAPTTDSRAEDKKITWTK